MNNSSKYFFNRCFELLHSKTFDSYRISLHNPYTIFIELGKAIEKYNKKKIKNYSPSVTDIGEEAYNFINNDYLKNSLSFGSFSKKHISDLLLENCIKPKSEKKLRSLSLIAKTIEIENVNFRNVLIEAINQLIKKNSDDDYEELNTLTGWLITQCQYSGFSRKFIYLTVSETSKAIFKRGIEIDLALDKMNTVFESQKNEYKVYFKIRKNTAQTFEFTSNSICEIEELPQILKISKNINNKFKEKVENETFFEISINEFDFWSALQLSYQIVNESLELNILHGSDNKLTLEKQAVIVHSNSDKFRVETIEQEIDGFYTYNEIEFQRFISNFKSMDEDSVSREKIRSAIKFYKLGNESLEIEHKILNYWIGFEQLFSSVDSSEDSITRMKTFFVALNSTYYLQRRTNYLLDSLKRKEIRYNGRAIEKEDLKNSLTLDFQNISGSNPLYLKRLEKYLTILTSHKSIKALIEIHTKRLSQHLTRIYRVRNELIHEGRTSSDLTLIAGHLRHYLLFTIEQVTNELNENNSVRYLDDVFVYYENLAENIKSCKSIQEVYHVKDYKGYME